MAISYEVGADMAIVLRVGSLDESVVKGLNSIGLPGLERTVIEVEEFRNEFSRQFAGGGKTGTLTFAGNYVLGDTNGQDKIREYLISREKFTDAWVYLNTLDFIAPDLAADPISGWQVTKYTPGQADKNAVIPIDGELVLNGMFATYTAHYEHDDVSFADSNPDTITDASGHFVSDGFEAGMSIIVVGSASNDGHYTIASLTDTVLTLSTTDSLIVEAMGADVAIHGGRM